MMRGCVKRIKVNILVHVKSHRLYESIVAIRRGGGIVDGSKGGRGLERKMVICLRAGVRVERVTVTGVMEGVIVWTTGVVGGGCGCGDGDGSRSVGGHLRG